MSVRSLPWSGNGLFGWRLPFRCAAANQENWPEAAIRKPEDFGWSVEPSVSFMAREARWRYSQPARLVGDVGQHADRHYL